MTEPIDGEHGRVMLRMYACGCWQNRRRNHVRLCEQHGHPKLLHETGGLPGWVEYLKSKVPAGSAP